MMFSWGRSREPSMVIATGTCSKVEVWYLDVFLMFVPTFCRTMRYEICVRWVANPNGLRDHLAHHSCWSS